ncbi:DUF6931 family protein [Methylotuvimicrobium sp. KM1]|uniref:DUF6931 family protein n=1 Tax=Methylotuvimicrobium sp. KM1 TaxID=3377707 RepID=UPI00384EEB7A
MTEINLIKIKQEKAAEISGLFELSELGQSLLTQEGTPAEFIEKLIQEECFTDCINFIAYGLPKREATWWACLCARSCQSTQTNPKDAKAVELAEAWVYKPIQENAKAAFTAAEATAFKTAAGWAATAAFWSGDNLSPLDGNIVPPAPDLTAKAVAGAIMLAASQDGAAQVKNRKQTFIRQGIDIANGGDGRKVES